MIINKTRYSLQDYLDGKDIMNHAIVSPQELIYIRETRKKLTKPRAIDVILVEKQGLIKEEVLW